MILPDFPKDNREGGVPDLIRDVGEASYPSVIRLRECHLPVCALPNQGGSLLSKLALVGLGADSLEYLHLFCAQSR